jgi:hypothetical protein
MSTVESIIALGWRGQAKGSRTELEERLTVLQLYLDTNQPAFEVARRDSVTYPINEQTAFYRKEIALQADKLYKTINAYKVISAELNRRGGRND